MKLQQKLIFDIGLHEGEDTTYYLEKGYNVLAVEANPNLAELCRQKFERQIASGQLRILNVGVAKEKSVLPFYINLHTTEWSSFDKAIGNRDNTGFKTIDIPCVTAKSLFEEYGIPYYLKVDIEGYDYLCLTDIPDQGEKPNYVSCEAVHLEWLDILKQKGYTKFKLINQADGFKPINLRREKAWYYPMYRKIENGIAQRARRIIKFKHLSSSSGPFAEETKGNWKSYEEIRQLYIGFYQGDLKQAVNKVSWWDFHAAL